MKVTKTKVGLTNKMDLNLNTAQDTAESVDVGNSQSSCGSFKRKFKLGLQTLENALHATWIYTVARYIC